MANVAISSSRLLCLLHPKNDQRECGISICRRFSRSIYVLLSVVLMSCFTASVTLAKSPQRPKEQKNTTSVKPVKTEVKVAEKATEQLIAFTIDGFGPKNFKKIKELVALGGDVNRGNSCYPTLLQWALWGNHFDMARFLLQHGANPNLSGGQSIDADGKRITNSVSWSPLVNACIRKDIQEVRFLLQYKPLLNQETECLTPLIAAIKSDDLSIVQMLLEHGANVNAKTSLGTAPLLQASWKGNLEIVKILLKHQAQIKIESKSSGSTPLMESAYMGHLPIVRLLIKNGARVNHLRSKDGATALFLASYMGHTDIVRFLIQHGANVNQPYGPDKWSPLFVAASNGHVKIVQTLLQAGADVNHRNTHHKTALDVAKKNNRKKIIRLLIKHGVKSSPSTVPPRNRPLF